MKLQRIWIHQFQQFRVPLEVADLEAGINLFVGPNESGKSTLVRAIRAAFFERHRTGTLGNLQPWGDTSAAPEVSLEFEWQGNRWQLNKRFMKRERCDLQAAGQHLSSDEAETKLAELLGYEFPGRGESQPKHQGIPGLLWVEQGVGQEVHEPVGHAGAHLQSALSESLGDALREVASSSGDALISQVERERGQLLTGTGKPTGENRDAQKACEALESELAKLDEQVAQYRDQVDRLGQLQRDQRDHDTTRPWEAQRKKAKEAEQQLEAVEKLQQQQTQEQRELDTCQRNQQLYRRQLQDFDSQAQLLDKRQREKEQAQQQLDRCQANDEPIQRRLHEAQTVYAQANTRLTAARRHARRQALQEDHARLAKQVEQLAVTREKAQGLRDSMQQLAEQHQAYAVDDKALARLQDLEKALGKLAIQQQALATRLGYVVEPGQQLTLGDKSLSGEGEALLLQDSELRIPGVVTLTIKPGGSDVGELLRRQQRLETDRDALLQELGVPDLATAEQRARAASELAQRIQQERARLEGLAPEGVDELESQYRLAAQRRDQLAAELAQLPEVEGSAELPTEEQAQASLERASEQLKAAEQAEREQREALSLAKQALNTTQAEWQKLYDELHAPDRQLREKEARDTLTDLKAEASRLADLLSERQREIDAANPEVLAQDVERFSKAAESLEKAAREREVEIGRLQSSLESLGAQGLEEQRDDKRQTLERQQRRRDQLARRAAALDLLLTLLKEERQAVTRQLQAPLQKHLNHYLKLLFPGAELSVDEDLKPETLIRGEVGREERGELTALSFGAREQMGLISRLAYADLLQEAGRPTLIILDDALVHSDRERREQMKRILYDAARRHQILLFTCHPEHWQDLGVVPREMRSLKTAAATADAPATS
jgi:energy-coupling factor transporter ATP-binding protein EcfA2